MKTIIGVFVITILLASLAACGAGTPPNSSQAPVSSSSASVTASPPSSSEPDDVSAAGLIGPNIDKAPAGLSDLDAVTKIYVWPLIATGRIADYPWETPMDIVADDLIDMCAYNNLLGLPLNPADGTIFGGASYVNWEAPGEQVEAAIQKHFDVTGEYLQTAGQYNAEAKTYEMVSGWGGGWSHVATSAEQKGSQIVIGIGIQGPDDGPVTPVGTLTVELTDGNTVKYISNEVGGSTNLSIDVTDLEGLKENYLLPILFSAASRSSWTDANTIAANMLVDMYGYMNLWNGQIPESAMEFEGEIPYYYLEQSILEDYVRSYFVVSVDHLRSSDRYAADRKAYQYNMSGVGWAYDPFVRRAEYDDSSKILMLYLDDGFEHQEEAAILTIQLKNDGSFKYISNEAVPIP